MTAEPTGGLVRDPQPEPAAQVNEQPQPRAAWLGALAAAVLYLFFFTAMTLFNADPPRLPPAAWIVFAVGTTLAYLIILLFTIRLLCRVRLKAWHDTALMLAALLFCLALNPAVQNVVQRLGGGEDLLLILTSVPVMEMPMSLQVIVPFFLILTGIFGGRLLARLIRERALLLPVALVAGLIDFWGVYWGPVAAMSEKAEGAVSGIASASTAAATVAPEMKATMSEPLRIVASIAPPDQIGIGDFVFVAFFLACAYRLGFSARRTMWGIFGGLLLSSVIIALDGIQIGSVSLEIQYLPGLVFIAGGMIFANLPSWKLHRQEWIMTGTLVGILLTCIGISIARAEMDKPQLSSQALVLTAPTPEALATQVLARLRAERNAPPEILPLIAGIGIDATDGQPTVAQVHLLYLGRRADDRLRGYAEYDVMAQRDEGAPGRWQVGITRYSPPGATPNLVRSIFGMTGEDAAVLRKATGIPTAAWVLLADVSRWASLTKKPQYNLYLDPRHAYLIDGPSKENKHMISYPPTAETGGSP